MEFPDDMAVGEVVGKVAGRFGKEWDEIVILPTVKEAGE
jgi:hypothetical protein